MIELFENYFPAFCKLRICRKEFLHICSQSFGLVRLTIFYCYRSFYEAFASSILLWHLLRRLKTFILDLFIDGLEFLFY